MSTVTVNKPTAKPSAARPGLPEVLSRVGVGARWAIAVIALAFVALYYPWFYKQGQFSAGAMEDWGHSFAMPFLCGYLAWRERARILATPVTTFWPGILPLVLGVMCYFFFVVGVSNHLGQGLGVLLSLSGVLMLTLGPAMFRFMFLPVAFLGLGITLPQQVMEMLTFKLKLIASEGAGIMLQVVSLGGSLFDVESKGNIITIEGHDLNVADQCSGMRMVIAFAALSAAVAVLGCREWWQRVVMVSLATPVAVAMNVIRVALLGLATLVDKDLASGDAHKIIGVVLMIPTLFLFMGMTGLLERAVARPGTNGAKAVGA